MTRIICRGAYNVSSAVSSFLMVICKEVQKGRQGGVDAVAAGRAVAKRSEDAETEEKNGAGGCGGGGGGARRSEVCQITEVRDINDS